MKRLGVGIISVILVVLGVVTGRLYFDMSVLQSAVSSALLSLPSEPVPEPPPEVSLIAVGDIMLSRNVAAKMRRYGHEYPFVKVADYLKTGDLVFGNFELPITPGRVIKTGEMVFRAEPGVEKILKKFGFSILSLANNHTPNFGAKGLKDTFVYLKKAGINYVGAGENLAEAEAPVFIKKNGITFAFLAYNDADVVPKSYRATDKTPGTAFMDKARMAEAVKKAKEQADFVIVSMHSGVEYVHEPNKSQKEFARAAVDAGAEMVIGHHPHVIQRAEKYKGKYIFYSLGNFVFDQMWSLPTRRGLILKAMFGREGVKNVEFVPVLIEDYAQPRIMEDGPVRQNIIKTLERELYATNSFSFTK